MPTTKEFLSTLEELFKHQHAVNDKIAALKPDQFFDSNLLHEVEATLKEEQEKWRKFTLRAVAQYERFPERCDALFRSLNDFYAAAPVVPNPQSRGPASFENSVFVMTKFPGPGAPNSTELQAVIHSVKEAITECGCFPRIASEKDYHEWLWANVELYLLGCSSGIAIVEDRYRPELNPNVAMEWGWMRGMGRRVLFLREKSFHNDRADWSGLVTYDFDWMNPKLGVEAAIKKFLT
jgi:hypothetical protein